MTEMIIHLTLQEDDIDGGNGVEFVFVLLT